MTVTTTTNRAVLQGNGVALTFDFSFKVLEESHLVVERRIASTGVVDKIYILDTEYTISGIGADEGSVTLIGAAPSSLYEIIITRVVPYTQELDIVNQGGFFPELVENQLDLMVMQTQQLTTQVDDDVAAAQAAADLAEQYLASISALGSSTTVYRTKAAAAAAAAGLADDAAVWVLVDSSKNNTLSLYRVVNGGLEYMISLSGASDQSPIPTGVLFDTEGVDNFTDMQFTPHAALTVNAGTVVFSSASTVSLPLKVLTPDDILMRIASDYVTIDATITLTSYPAAGDPGTFLGMLNDALGTYGLNMVAHGGTNTQTLPALLNAGSSLAFLSSGEALATTVRVQYARTGNKINVTFTFDADPNRTIPELTQLFDTSYEMQRLFQVPMIRFEKGVSTVTKFKVTQGFPGAKFAFIGDSLTQGRLATNYSEGFPQLARTANPGEVAVYAAPSATTADWLVSTYHVTEMWHRYAFILLGINDLATLVPIATAQANFTNLMNEFIANDIVPIVLTLTPSNISTIPAFNTWLKAQGWRYIDIHPLLVAVDGINMHASYSAGDGLPHLNTAGNLVIWNAISDYITAEAL